MSSPPRPPLLLLLLLQSLKGIDTRGPAAAAKEAAMTLASLPAAEGAVEWLLPEEIEDTEQILPEECALAPLDCDSNSAATSPNPTTVAPTPLVLVLFAGTISSVATD